MVSEHSMNETILAPIGDPVGLTVMIAPWSSTTPVDSNATPGIKSRVDVAAASLVLSLEALPLGRDTLAGLRALMAAAVPLLNAAPEATVTLGHSGVVLDANQLGAALASWTDAAVPVHSLIAFDFAVRGDPPGTCSTGLAALVGQEVAGWPTSDSLRLICARMVVRLAHDMLIHGPILTETEFPAPDTPRGSVTLVPRATPLPVVQIRF